MLTSYDFLHEFQDGIVKRKSRSNPMSFLFYMSSFDDNIEILFLQASK